jgi:hypothetical protein
LNLDENSLPEIWYGPCCEKRSAEKSVLTGAKKTISIASTDMVDNTNSVKSSAFTHPGGTGSGNDGSSIFPTAKTLVEGRVGVKTNTVKPQIIGSSSANISSEKPCTTIKQQQKPPALNSLRQGNDCIAKSDASAGSKSTVEKPMQAAVLVSKPAFSKPMPTQTNLNTTAGGQCTSSEKYVPVPTSQPPKSLSIKIPVSVAPSYSQQPRVTFPTSNATHLAPLAHNMQIRVTQQPPPINLSTENTTNVAHFTGNMKVHTAQQPSKPLPPVKTTNVAPPQCIQPFPIAQKCHRCNQLQCNCKSIVSSSQLNALKPTTNTKIITQSETTKQSYPCGYRTVVVPAGVLEGSMFHVLTQEGRKMGVICPKGVRPGQTLIVVDPGHKFPPILAEKIVEMNEARLVEKFDPQEAEFARRAFWKILFPYLQASGWSFTRETNYNFGAFTFFGNLQTEIRLETVAEVLAFLESNGSYKHVVHLFRRSIENQKEAAQQNTDTNRQGLEEKMTPEKKKIRIGSNYQVRSLPRAGSFEPGTSNEYM